MNSFINDSKQISAGDSHSLIGSAASACRSLILERERSMCGPFPWPIPLVLCLAVYRETGGGGKTDGQRDERRASARPRGWIAVCCARSDYIL